MQADPNLVLVKSIAVIYLNRKLKADNKRAISIIEELLKNIIMPANLLGEGVESEITKALKVTLEWLIKETPDTLVLPVDIVERVRINCLNDSSLIITLDNILSHEAADEDETHMRVGAIINELKSELKQQRFSQIFKKANKDVNFSFEQVDTVAFTREMLEKLNEFNGAGEGEVRMGFQGGLSSEDPDSLISLLDNAKELDSDRGALRTGLQGLNRALGGKGFKRGEMVNFGALSHNYKTGILLDLFRQIPMYNTPLMVDPTKKPLILRISFENKPEQDVPEIAGAIMEQELKKNVALHEIDSSVIADKVISKLTRNGYFFAMECYDPNNMTVWDIIDILEDYNNKGYEVHALDLDYLALVTRPGKDGNKEQVIQHAYEVLRNHCYPRGITVLTAHQLSTEALAISREGHANFTQKIGEGAYYMDCKGIRTKLDCEFILHIHKVGDRSVLMFYKGKHRGQVTPEEHKTFGYVFQPYGGICDDVEEEESQAISKLSEVGGNVAEYGTVDHEAEMGNAAW